MNSSLEVTIQLNTTNTVIGWQANVANNITDLVLQPNSTYNLTALHYIPNHSPAGAKANLTLSLFLGNTTNAILGDHDQSPIASSSVTTITDQVRELRILPEVYIGNVSIGDNEITFVCDVTPDVHPRARVTTISQGEPLE